jgi:hypothetical protein
VLVLLHESEHLTTETRKRNSAVDRDVICYLKPEVLRSWECGSYETEFMDTEKNCTNYLYGLVQERMPK